MCCFFVAYIQTYDTWLYLCSHGLFPSLECHSKISLLMLLRTVLLVTHRDFHQTDAAGVLAEQNMAVCLICRWAWTYTLIVAESDGFYLVRGQCSVIDLTELDVFASWWDIASVLVLNCRSCQIYWVSLWPWLRWCLDIWSVLSW